MVTLNTAGANAARIPVRVRSITWEVDGILAFELGACDGSALPAFSVGSHIDVHMTDALARSYSLLGRRQDGLYRIAVHRGAQSRGGSLWMHEQLRAGQVLHISPPRNAFALVPDGRCVLIGGGIGITPLIGMAEQCDDEGRDWSLHYATRTRPALLEAWCDERRERVTRYVTASADGSGGQLDIAALVAAEPAGTHFYCCGPQPMIDAYLEATRHLPETHVHLERFTAEPLPAHDGFSVHLARDGRTFEVPSGQSILKVLLDAGVDVSFACTQGICGLCQTRVLEGEPEHRDECLTPEEHAAEGTMMICCSGAKSNRLVLDL